MGRYSNGNKDYDQSIWNNLWNAPPFFQRDLAVDRNRTVDPRVHLTFAIHIWSVMVALQSN